MNDIDVKDALLAWYKEEADYEQCEYCDAYINSAIESYDVVDGKYVTYYSVFKDEYTGKHYEVASTRTNNGYWGDSELVDEEVYEVIAKQVVKTVWEAI